MDDQTWLGIKRRRGVVRRVADGLGITTQAVSQWRRVPSDRVAQVAELLNLSTRVLRPDLHRETPATTGPLSNAVSTVRIGAELVRQAEALGVDLSVVAEEALRDRLADLRREQWLAENQGAFEDANRFLETYGLWSDGLRQF